MMQRLNKAGRKLLETAFISRRGDYRTVFGTPAGRRVLADLLRFSGVHDDRWEVGMPADAAPTMLGMQKVGLHIIKNLRLNDAEIIDLVSGGDYGGEDED